MSGSPPRPDEPGGQQGERPGGLHPLRADNIRHRRGCAGEIVIDEDVVVANRISMLFAGMGQPQVNHIVGIRSPGAQPTFQLAPGGGEHEDQHRTLAENLADGSPALHIDVANHIHPVVEAPLELLGGGAVVVPVHQGMLHEGLPLHHGLELLLGDEVVGHTRRLVGS